MKPSPDKPSTTGQRDFGRQGRVPLRPPGHEVPKAAQRDPERALQEHDADPGAEEDGRDVREKTSNNILTFFCHSGCSAFAYTIPFRDP